MALVLRNEKGSKLTHSELDGNFLYLKGLIDGITLVESPVSSDQFGWNQIELVPGNPVTSINNGSIINLELNANPELWTTPIYFNGIDVLPGFLQDGAVGIIRNTSLSTIRLAHLNTASRVPLNITSNQDFELLPNSIVQMVYSERTNQMNVIANDATPIMVKTPTSEVFRLNESEASQPNIFLTLAAEPAENEFVDVFINGLHVNNEDLIIDGANVVIARTNVDYNIKEGMQVTVNYKY